MKSLEELSMTTTSDIDDFIDTIFSDVVLKTAREKTIGRDLVEIHKMPDGSNEMVFAIADKLTSTSFTEGGTLTTSQLSLTSSTLTLDQHYGVSIDVSQTVIDDEQINVLKTGISEMAEALIQKQDDYIIETLLGKTTQTAEAIGGWTLASAGYATLALSNDLVLDYPTKAVYSGGSTFSVSKIDFYDGKIEVQLTSGSTIGASTTPAYYYSALSYASDVSSASTLSFTDIVDAQYSIKGRYESPNWILCSPRAYSLLLKSDQFVHASLSGDNSALRRGIVGNISGMTTIVSTKVPDSAILVFAKDRYTKMTERPHYTKRHDEPKTDSVQIYGYARFGVERIFEGSAQLVLNISSWSKDL